MHNKRRPQDAQESYCRRLLHQCRKDLHKQAKVCKNFECQKLIRKLKQQQEPPANDKTQDSVHHDKLHQWRHLSLDVVVQECFKRLGILDLLVMEPTMDDSVIAQQQQEPAVMERVLQHKRMREALEKWSVQITEYRTWCHRRREEEDRPKRQGSAKRKRPSDHSREQQDGGVVAFSESLFTTLNDDDGTQKKKKKKNRAGQQARRAMAQQKEQQEEETGVPMLDNSRRPTTTRAAAASHHPKTFASSLRRSTPPGRVANNTKEEEESLHPSWQARKQQTSGIVAFAGTKITFDNDED